MIDNARRANRLSFDEAVLQTREQLRLLQPAALEDLDALVAEHEAEVAHATKLSEKSTSFVKDDIARGWYTPHTRPDGVWEKLRNRMSHGGLADAVGSIDESSDAIVAHLAEPNVSDDLRKGLVIGNVQSGKTANYAAVIAKALDEGYKLVIVMSGVHSNLRRQTQRRLERDLGTDEDNADWFRLTSVDGDIGRADIKNAANIVDTNSRTIAVVKKNSRRLSNLRDFLRAVDPGTMQRTPILIIDDESDQATPDASTDSAESPTAINLRMREIWDEVSNGTYAGYTATPFANVFMDPAEAGDLYPSNFLSVMPTPDTYFGAERLFGLSDASIEAPDVIRYIADAELEHLLPRTAKDAADFEPQVTESLAEAIRWFIVAAAVRRIRGQATKHSTMLIHTTHRVDPHFLMRDEVNRFLKPLQDEALDGETDSFYDVFHAEMNRAAELDTGDGPAPTWPSVKAEIPNVLRTLKVAVDNGSADESERLDYETDPAQTVIVIGGGTLSRGLTLEGLFVSFFTRTSNTYDTLLQMGRWFGYRAGYEDLQRIWVSPGLDSDYRFLAAVESDLRVEVERMAAGGLTPSQIGLRIRQHPGRLQVTSKNKMRHVEEVEVDFEGQQFQTTKFDVSDPDALLESASSVRQFLSGLASYGADRAEDSGAVLFDGVEASKVLGFLESFSAHDDLEDLLAGAVQWTREKLPERPWNVVLANGSTREEYRVGDVTVHAVNRAPLAANEGGFGDPTVNIRALMSAGDLVSDLAIMGRLSGSDRHQLTNKRQKALRAQKGVGDGRGLLVLYPISRSSTSSSRTRQKMADVLGAVDPRLVSPNEPPIFGIGLVTPFDVDGVIRNKGSYVAVRPPYTDDPEDSETETIIDDERDFDGGSA
ncbi:Z1 domain-containing protein [Brevibacterium jeotgali]|uniref:Z1 domain-containing protein n=1 Tax=Brevibacterium jeotgali TaxID=1262550 RepID=A0A2H1L3V6_9MICO|nr:Z1 domain-containing protein [Brevibacterium jeotgali]TWC01670.1 Z1 domain-containing protein [Brevibacterium jeotgali]SMY11415.1 Z1 domain-containing protein [Brevibacterium jeotgali]